MTNTDGLERWRTSPEGRAHIKRLGESKRTHGASLRSSPNYGAWVSWRAMRTRCDNPRHHEWERYGGRGITYDPRWRSFENFLADMGPRPVGCSIDRIDNDGNYEPGNCRWTDQRTQRQTASSGRGWKLSKPRAYGTKPMTCTRCQVVSDGHAGAPRARWLCSPCRADALRESRARARAKARAARGCTPG